MDTSRAQLDAQLKQGTIMSKHLDGIAEALGVPVSDVIGQMAGKAMALEKAQGESQFAPKLPGRENRLKAVTSVESLSDAQRSADGAGHVLPTKRPPRARVQSHHPKR